jgi:UDP-N-acetylglucosamine acyltransferase
LLKIISRIEERKVTTAIHSTAIVESGAELGEDVVIGAYAYVGKDVHLGDKCEVRHHASVDGRTTLGRENIIYPYAFIGGLTQDLKYKGGNPGLRIGNGNVFREYTTVHVSTSADCETLVGNYNTVLAYAHIGHDCVVGNSNIISSLAALGGHCVMGNYTNIAWNAGIHQYVKVGNYAMAAAAATVTMDLLPFMLAHGSPARVRTFNRVLLERQGFTAQAIADVKYVYRLLYRSSYGRRRALQLIAERKCTDGDVFDQVLSFASQSERGFC